MVGRGREPLWCGDRPQRQLVSLLLRSGPRYQHLEVRPKSAFVCDRIWLEILTPT